MIKESIAKVTSGGVLSTEEAAGAMTSIMSGEASPAQIAGLIVALKQRGETVSEVAGFVRAMRQHAVSIEIDDDGAVDGVGTGGDGAHTFNVSTASALVAAASGVTVAKHGNRSVSSKCGSADLLEATGGNIDPGPDRVRDNINQFGFGFMFAPRFHPAMKHAVGPRSELGIRTVFNILGPMTNPAGVTRQVTGVFAKSIMSLMAEVLLATGTERALILHSRDGLDEISVSAPTDYLEIRDGGIKPGVIEPEKCGIDPAPPDALRGGDAQFNHDILRRVFDGEKSAYLDAVIINAAALIWIADKVDSLPDGLAQAREAISFGAAKNLLDRWTKESQV